MKQKQLGCSPVVSVVRFGPTWGICLDLGSEFCEGGVANHQKLTEKQVISKGGQEFCGGLKDFNVRCLSEILIKK